MAEATHPLRTSTANWAGDLVAGVTLWAVLAAQALAYSRLAHATAAAGLATATAGACLYAILGTSRRTSMGPAGAIAAIVGTAVANVATDQLATSITLLTLLTGVFLVVGGCLRISFIRRLFPVPVFTGYLAGTGVTILIGQTKDLVSHGALALAIGAAAIVCALALKQFLPRAPGPFVVLLAATVASIALRLDRHGVPVIGTSFGEFGRAALPQALDLGRLKSLAGPALSLALLVYVDAIANGEALAKKGDPEIRPIREFFALGAANLASGLLGGFVAGCSTSRSLLGIKSGERTKLAGGVAGILCLLMALSVVEFLKPMPLAALAGVVFIAAIDLIDVAKFHEFWSLRRADFWIALAAAVAVVLVGPVWGVGLGVIGALGEVFRRATHPHRSVVLRGEVSERIYEPFSPDSLPIENGIAIYRFGTGLFFGNADVFLADMKAIAERADPSLHTVVINADALGVPDASARAALMEARDVLAAHDIRLVFGNARQPLREALRRVGTFTLIDEREFLADMRRLRSG